MKNVSYLLFICILIFTGCAKDEPEPEPEVIIDIPDEYFLIALIDEGVDTNGDSLISFAEAQVVNKLEIEGLNDDLKGIEAFVHLDTLTIWNHGLTSIDLSSNLKLKYLYLGGHNCWFLGNCPSINLDLSKNIALEYLDCYESEIAYLNITSCVSLKELYLWDNSLKDLDVSNNSALTHLDCYANELLSIDISNNIALIELHCGANEITNLDISKNKSLTILGASHMATLHQVCVWDEFNINSIIIDTAHSSNVFFTADCSK